MKKIALFLSIFCLAGGAYAVPQNIETARQALIKYHDSGQYQRDLQSVYDAAKTYLADKIASNKSSAHPRKLAVVFDIDETTLSNYDSMKQLRFGGTLDEIEQAVAAGHDKVIQPALAFYRYAVKNHVAIFFITGRKNFERAATVRNLHTAGFTHWSAMVFKPKSYHKASAAPYKAHARAQIEKQGYDIVATIGDQLSDIEGGHADKGFKLPNPYYYIP